MHQLTEKIKKLIPLFFNRETVSYVIFGVLTTLINWGVSRLCYDYLPISIPLVLTWSATAIAWIAAVIFAFITNKLFVFESKSLAPAVLKHEIITFFSARLLSFVIDLIGMSLLVDAAHWNSDLSKMVMNIIVIVINYVLSKRFIFNKKDSANPQEMK